MLRRLLLPLLIIPAVAANAQQLGGNPPSVKWQQVNTPAAKVIFPKGLDSSALNVAAIVARINNSTKPTIGTKQRQVSILLQNQSTISNAYVGLAPFRSEFYLTPSQNSFQLGSLRWTDQLAIHEFRHVQQYNNFNVGLSHVLKLFFGEGGQALGNALSVPDYFFEGDAVYNETHVSRQGRGRLPDFMNDYRSLWIAGKDYSWMKLRNGSYRDFVPNHYPLGYMLVAYGYQQYGNNFWKDVTQHAAAFKGGFYPWQQAIQKYSGKTYAQFRTDALAHFKNEFRGDVKDVSANPNQHFIADEQYPAFVNDSTVVYLKTTYDRVGRFVINTAGREKDIAVKNITTDSYFSYANGKIIYSAFRPDARWGYRQFNELVVLDINTHSQKRITRRTKYFSPSISADGKSIVAVSLDEKENSALHLLDMQGRLQSVLPNPGNLFYTYPKFYSDDRLIAAVRNPAGQMALVSTNMQGKDMQYLVPYSYNPIGFTQVQDKLAYFTQTKGLKDVLFAVDLTTKQIFEVTGGKVNKSISFYQPAAGPSKFAWVKPTAFGNQLIQVSKSDVKLEPVSSGGQKLLDFGITKLSADSTADLLDKTKPSDFAVTKYGKAYNLFNFHSLFPTVSDPNYSLALVGENVLNTFQSEVSFNYNRNEGYKSFGFEGIYGGLYPFISAGGDYTIDRNGYANGRRVYYNETALHAGLRVPFNLSVGNHYTNFSVGSSIYYSQNHFQQPFRAQYRDRSYAYLSNTISFSNQVQQARKQINPLFAQSVSLNYKKSVTNLDASQILATGSIYLPGLFNNHSLVLSGAYQQKGQNNAIGFSNDFPFSKGYGSVSLQSMDKFGASYHFPIAYPDAGVANLLYILRLRGYLYYDHTHATQARFYTNGASFNGNFRSAGAAVFFDARIFNQQPISFGIRYSHLFDPDVFGGNGKNRIELVLPVAIF
ncbi:hypothetical protein FPZ43_03860 [Mucilaginibacter pallidiroseus]|uniref:Protein TolB n=1 Tax=Mucilaginibacter pallidiroseus TaxID=2599295 RepID=A0A563UJS4_9SPHI|nr:hypothetical protein [Mucilaginibacter pallidiroseus]TWR31617.1 hypothetical protein FPZ43_03860 [Mucilaginibacter pallidiroseus]